MRQKNLSFQRRGKLSAEQRRLLPVVAIPLVVMILMAIIVFADWKKKDNQADPAAATDTQQVLETMENPESGAQSADGPDAQGNDTAGAEDAQGNDAAGADGEETAGDGTDGENEAEDTVVSLRQDSDPEILSLMKRYFKARASADAETMNSLYGIGEADAATLEEQKARMRSNSKYVQSFENITTYVKDGVTADSWLVYAVSDIRFHAVKTAAPMIMWCYVTKDADGNYRISDNTSLSPEILQYIDAENRSEEVRRLASSVNVALKEALISDEDLNEVYGVLREGSPVWKGEEETAVVQILDVETDTELESEDETGAETDTESGADAETGTESETMIDLTSGDICTDDFSGESAVLDDGSGQMQQSAPQMDVN